MSVLRAARRHRLALLVTVVLGGLAVNVWVQDGGKAFLVVMVGVVGCLLVVGSVAWLTGAQVVRHSHAEATAIESGTHPMKKELGR
jgi:hypothetical protein